MRHTWKYTIGAALLLIGSVGASAQSLPVVTIAHGSNQVEITHPGLYLPKALGWAKEEGIDLQVQTTAGSQQALQLLAGGRADFVTVNTETIINGRDQGAAAIIVYSMVNQFSAEIAVLANGPIKSVADMNGTQVGVFSLQSGGVPYLKAVMREAGLNPETDVTIVPTGAGAPGLQALNSGTVSALSLWAGAFAVYTTQGANLKIFRSAALAKAPAYVLATTEEYLAKNPKMVEKVGRMIAKSAVFAMENPPAAVEAYWVALPQNKPAEVTAKGRSDAETVLRVGLGGMTVAERTDKRWGWNDPVGYTTLQKYLIDNGVRKTVVPDDKLYSNAFVDAYNQFDAAAVRTQARSYKP